MKKRLNVNAIQNELRGGSAFFPGYKGTKSTSDQQTETVDHSPTQEPPQVHVPQKETPQPQQTIPAPPVRDVPLVRDVRPVPIKRIMKQRWPVDIYQDQYEALKQIAQEDRMRGGVGSMSAMIREALDNLIAKKRRS